MRPMRIWPIVCHAETEIDGMSSFAPNDMAALRLAMAPAQHDVETRRYLIRVSTARKSSAEMISSLPRMLNWALMRKPGLLTTKVSPTTR